MDKQWNLKGLYMELFNGMIEKKIERVAWDENTDIRLVDGDKFEVWCRDLTDPEGDEWFVTDKKTAEELYDWFERKDFTELKRKGA